MSIKTRFAPSPTGFLHVGNARAALFCYLFAKAANGAFMLRYDDTDAARSTSEYADAIAEDLRWLGLTPDETARQSERFARYEAAFSDLVARGLVYACYESPEELEKKRKRQLARGLPPVYDRAALELSEAEKAALDATLDAEGHKPHWRFKLSGEMVAWEDLIRGTQKIDMSSVSDPVIRRGDGTWLYSLPSVVDDMDFNVSHVIRGEDHVTNTATQIEMIAALGGQMPAFAHFSLLLAEDGSALSKRLGDLMGGLTLRELCKAGYEAMALNSLLARLGTSDAVVPVQSMDELIANFDIARLGRAPARFNRQDVARLNARILHDMAYAVAQPRLAALDVTQDENFWQVARGNLNLFSDITAIQNLIEGQVTPVIESQNADYLAQALAALPAAPLDGDSWTIWTTALKQQTGRKGRDLFMPLRLALTGQAHGPEMNFLLPLIGYDKASIRLSGKTG